MEARSVRRALSIALLAGAALTPHAMAAQQDTAATWAPIREVFAAKGEAEDGYLRVEFPRKDLSVTIGTQRLAPAFELTSYMGFVPAGTGRVLAMGEVVLTDAEAGAAVGEARAQGVSVPALHNHLLHESPRLMYMHVLAEGDPKSVAEKLQHILARTGAGGKAEQQEEAPAQGQKAEGAWSAASATLGKPEKAEDTTAEWEFPRREALTVHGTPVKSSGVIETASEVVMQRLAGGKVATTGELYLLPQEIDAVSQALSQGGIQVTAIHNHMTTVAPRLYWLHWYATGDEAALGRTIRAALGHTNHRLPAAGSR